MSGPSEQRDSPRLAVIGQGYVGLPMALRAAEVGIRVTGLDSNTRVVADLNRGVSHIDDVSAEDLAAGREQGYRATTDPACIASADVVIVCVPTPLAPDGGPDLEAVRRAAEMQIVLTSVCLELVFNLLYFFGWF